MFRPVYVTMMAVDIPVPKRHQVTSNNNAESPVMNENEYNITQHPLQTLNRLYLRVVGGRQTVGFSVVGFAFSQQ